MVFWFTPKAMQRPSWGTLLQSKTKLPPMRSESQMQKLLLNALQKNKQTPMQMRKQMCKPRPKALLRRCKLLLTLTMTLILSPTLPQLQSNQKLPLTRRKNMVRKLRQSALLLRCRLLLRKRLPLMHRQNRMRKLRQSALLLKCKLLLRKRLPLMRRQNQRRKPKQSVLLPKCKLLLLLLLLMRRQNRMRKLRQSALLLKCTLLRKRLPLTPSEN